jgi:V-type H+-transporting ATPase subunit a
VRKCAPISPLFISIESNMGTWWRSEDMSYVSIILSEETAPACIRELGILGCLQFTDLCPELTPFQRKYVVYIKRCDEIERKIRYLHEETKLMGVPIQPAGSVDSFVQNYTREQPISGAYLLESLESKLGGFEQQLVELSKYSKKLEEEYSHQVL